MSGLSWDHQFCLACDRQTDGATYCSESCRLSDFDKSASPYSTPTSSPGLEASSYGWTSSKPQTKFYLSPAYDFSHAQPYGSTPQAQSYLHRHSISSSTNGQLTPSSSYSSLSSLQSGTAAAGGEGKQLSETSKKQLRDYASSFEQARLQRRRSC
ncbi:CAAX farnesyltransferase (FTase) subunit beta [Pestalotiopsis sp. IQ-011]